MKFYSVLSYRCGNTKPSCNHRANRFVLFLSDCMTALYSDYVGQPQMLYYERLWDEKLQHCN